MPDYVYYLPVVLIPLYMVIISLFFLYLSWKESSKKTHSHAKVK